MLKKKAFLVTWRRSQFLNGIGRLSIVTEFPSYQRKFFSAFVSPGYYCHLTNSPVVRHFWQLELLSCSMIPLSSSILESESRFFNQLLIDQSETLKISHYWIAKTFFQKAFYKWTPASVETKKDTVTRWFPLCHQRYVVKFVSWTVNGYQWLTSV